MARISYMQEIAIMDLFKKLKKEGKIYGSIWVKVDNDGYQFSDNLGELISSLEGGILDELNLADKKELGKDVENLKKDDWFNNGFDVGSESKLEELRASSAIDIYEDLQIDDELILELVQYHNSKVEG